MNISEFERKDMLLEKEIDEIWRNNPFITDEVQIDQFQFKKENGYFNPDKKPDCCPTHYIWHDCFKEWGPPPPPEPYFCSFNFDVSREEMDKAFKQSLHNWKI